MPTRSRLAVEQQLLIFCTWPSERRGMYHPARQGKPGALCDRLNGAALQQSAHHVESVYARHAVAKGSVYCASPLARVSKPMSRCARR
ncbi:hypothetical protein WMF28_20445 [Sorangium sp. So ce590]|uniref:hypothetical protein n=1 Tax=Sorangium sp. So ce590 TaxID=3133317 RepID=UPI003F628495